MWKFNLYRTNSIESKYYADGEDALDMRKTLKEPTPPKQTGGAKPGTPAPNATKPADAGTTASAATPPAAAASGEKKKKKKK